MVAETASETAVQAHPQSANGMAQGGDDAPVFLSNSKDFFKLGLLGKIISRATTHTGSAASRCFGFGILYMAGLVIAGRFFPQIYQAWLDFCMPLVEYVGGLTPRADRIAGELIAGGYPERADDALHGIAMARVLAFPVLVCMMAGLFAASRSLPPVYICCTRRTHIGIWLRLLLVSEAIALAMVIYFGYHFEWTAGEGIGIERSLTLVHKIAGYHRGNWMMVFEFLGVVMVSIFFALAVSVFAKMRPARFTIVKQKPEDE